MSTIVELRAENFKRLKAVLIKPDPNGNLVIISGENAAGKSSCLDAISAALGGAAMSPDKPVREGHDKAKVRVELDDLIVEKTFTAAGSAQLTVMAKDGVKYPSPQAVLDKLVGKLCFDPVAFSRMAPKEQLSVLKTLVQLDFSALDRERQAAFDQRTMVNRELKQMQARLDGMPFNEGVPAAEVSMADLTNEFQRRQRVNNLNAEKRRAVDVSQHALSVLTNSRDQILEQIKQLEAKVAGIKDDIEFAEAKLADAQEAAAATQDLDLTEVSAQMQGVEATNTKVRNNALRKQLADTLKKTEDQSGALTKRIDEIDAKKKAALEAAKFPVPGLSFDESGVLFNGIPFSQASSAEKLKVSMAMSIALNPTLRVVLIRDASLLDSNSLKMVAEMAEKTKSQVWIERVSDGDPVGVVIEDGQVASVN